MDFSPELVKGTVVPIILNLLQERPMYGYEIIKVVNQRSDNAFAWKEGTLYPWLHRLEGDGLTTSFWQTTGTGCRRKYYRLTPRGVAAAREHMAAWADFSRAVNALLFAPTGG